MIWGWGLHLSGRCSRLLYPGRATAGEHLLSVSNGLHCVSEGKEAETSRKPSPTVTVPVHQLFLSVFEFTQQPTSQCVASNAIYNKGQNWKLST